MTVPSRQRQVWSLALALLLGVASFGFSPARAEPPQPNGAQAVAACDDVIGGIPQAGGRACRGFESVIWNAADACRSRVPLSPEDCAHVDGRVVAESEMQAYEASWVHRALVLQRGLDDGVPMRRALWPHTHNAFNAFAYEPTLTGLDANQVYSMRDQLRMDIRAIEMDVHWAPSIHGSSATGGKAVVLCHGRTDSTPVAKVHTGCSNDPPFVTGLVELKGWLSEAGNGDEIVLLYLQNELEGDPAAHDEATALIAAELGDLVYRPPTGSPCASVPLDVSRAAIRATGARVLVVGNCGPGAWGTWVHQRGPQWNEANSAMGDDYAGAGCAAERTAVGYDSRFVRRYEDSTRVSYWADRGGQVTIAETGRMVRCGVHMVGFDQLVPDDPRLAALVWSWAEGEPAVSGDCAAARAGDARFVARSCTESHPALCQTATGDWAVTSVPSTWDLAGAACASEFPWSTFSVPANGYEHSLVAAVASAADTWVAYARAGTTWSPSN